MEILVFAIIMIFAGLSANNRKRKARKEQQDKINELLEEIRKSKRS